MRKGEDMGRDRANDLGKLNDLLFEELARLNAVDAGGLLPTLKRILGTLGTWRDVLLRLADLVDPEGGGGDGR